MTVKTLMGRRTGGTSTYLFLPEIAGNYASAPDAAALEFAGDLELRVVFAPTKVPFPGGRRLISKFNTNSNQRSFVMYLPGGAVANPSPSGTDILLQISPDGTAQAVGRSDGGGMPMAPLGKIAVKSTWVQLTGTFQHFYSFNYDPDLNTGTWTQMGADVVDETALAGRFDCTAALEIGSSNGGAGANFGGRFYRAQVYSGIGGTKVFDVDFTRSKPGDTTVLDSVNGAVVTIFSAGAVPAAIMYE